jgi:hypothetical protein
MSASHAEVDLVNSPSDRIVVELILSPIERGHATDHLYFPNYDAYAGYKACGPPALSAFPQMSFVKADITMGVSKTPREAGPRDLVYVQASICSYNHDGSN